ncbi:hypothetical protein [Arundinibacter roseus]|uniref:hypothetical protein n=1 Tax=Arundinibacter roseus TaxID=2070510 RepID=UPI001404FB98|nr:hypothetical protein [Arundinibacter roseus]
MWKVKPYARCATGVEVGCEEEPYAGHCFRVQEVAINIPPTIKKIKTFFILLID